MLPKENPVLIRTNGYYIYPATINVPPPPPPNTPEPVEVVFTTIIKPK